MKTHKNYGIGHDYVDDGLYASFRSQALTCLIDNLHDRIIPSCDVANYLAGQVSPTRSPCRASPERLECFDRRSDCRLFAHSFLSEHYIEFSE